MLSSWVDALPVLSISCADGTLKRRPQWTPVLKLCPGKSSCLMSAKSREPTLCVLHVDHQRMPQPLDNNPRIWRDEFSFNHRWMSQLGHCSVSASFPKSACKHFRFAGDSEFMSEMQKQMQPKNSNSESAVSCSELRGCAAAWYCLYFVRRGKRIWKEFCQPCWCLFWKGCESFT